MDCPKRDKLLEQYYDATRAYNDVLTRIATLTGAEFEETRQQLYELRSAADHASQALTDHQQEHGC